MKEQNEFREFELISPVPAPADLFARIEARIQAGDVGRIPLRWAIAASLALALLVGSNVFFIGQRLSGDRGTESTELLVESMELSNHNQLYHD